MKIRKASVETSRWIVACGSVLREARHYAKCAGCPQLTKKINSALKSWDGARRHVHHRFNRTVDPSTK